MRSNPPLTPAEEAARAAETAELAASFVEETRALLEEANGALLSLERNPDDAEAVNALFRCVHSIKGAAGLFDLPAMIHLVHAGEDLLGAMRDGRLALDGELADQLLAGLDRVGRWNELFRSDGQLPAEAMEEARSFAALYRARLGEGAAAGTAAAAASPDRVRLPGWAGEAAAELAAAAAGEAVVLVEYAPDEGCFFAGDDPLRLVLATPGLAWLDIGTQTAWPEPVAFDPFACNLRFRLAARAPREAVEHHFRYVPDCISLVRAKADALSGAVSGAVSGADAASGDAAAAAVAEEEHPLDPIAIELLEAQRRALSLPGRASQVEDIETTVRNLCRSCGIDWPLGADCAGAETLAPVIDRLLARRDSVPAQAQAQDQAAGAASGIALDRHDAAGERTLRVEQGKVDILMNLVGELVVAKNALPFLARDAELRFGSRELSREIKDKYAVIDRISRQLQNAVMDIRMMPVSDLFKRFPRLVRDIARKQDKKVRLVIEGETTEADKNIIEALAEPLTHVLRNSLDHGIEKAGERALAGKDDLATLKLRAFQDGDCVVIEVIDDGRGIDPGKVRAKAVERGLLDAERVAQLSDAQAVQLVFLPGFSTADAVSDLSGRGVGMDAVRAVVERFGGNVVLESRSGEGTTVRLKLPLSMAVTRVLTVEMAGQLYGVPMDLVVETVRISPQSIRRLKASEAVVLRDQVIPIARLRDMLGMEAHRPALESVLILRVGNATVGMVIDDFGTGMDIILKPFSGILSNLSGFSGTAVLGDGRVLLVLNLKEIL
ncbi:chemotaxis protein CheA [Novosphingobium huizhouense]|uniref:chemotaxis protein CheA n=1 Tax=Novosphingobium huizhouense TaxID=2866625 RepID=UPI001CD8EDFA|nr:chemotaxis protein CheA [Novosphingobium huizhouense]